MKVLQLALRICSHLAKAETHFDGEMDIDCHFHKNEAILKPIPVLFSENELGKA
ncbi:hypothetical protein LLB_3710 [Legionella longbeachae D-4968]|nr:hypothetical protein LLB_3710 [Legionella longbeachae D-4968]